MNHRISFEALREMYEEEPVEAKEILMKDIAGYIREAENIEDVVEMLDCEDILRLMKQLNNRGARLSADELLDEVAPYHALKNVQEFIDAGASPDKLADKIFEEENLDIVFEQDAVGVLLKAGASPKNLFERCIPSIEGEFADVANDFIDMFAPYLPESYLARYRP